MKKLVKGLSILLLLCLSSSILGIAVVDAKGTKPTIWVTIYKIQSIDVIETSPDVEPEWYFEIEVWDGDRWISYTYPTTIGDGILTENNTLSFHLEKMSKNYTNFYITLLEEDTFITLSEVADISARSGTVRQDQRTPAPLAAIYSGAYNLITNSLSGDDVVLEEGYYMTSGELDGSVTTDENDAELWFSIWDNYEPPVADAGPNKTGYSLEKLTFDATGSTASNGSSLVLYEWDFQGDGVFDAQGSVMKHSYEKMGVHEAVLRVTDSIGETSVDTIKVTVLNREPLAAFNYTPQEPAFHEVISFLDASIDEDGSIVSWHWDFGDGATSTDANTSHAYEDKGTYLVTFTVTDDDGGVGEVTVEVPLKNLLPSARYTYSPTDLNAFDEIKFVDRSSDPEEKQLIYFWDFGDGSTSTEKDPIHIFEFSGAMTVSLTVTDDEGASDTFSKSLIVFPKVRPLADFTFSPEEATVGEQLSFLDKSEDDDGYIISWDWDFGDGDTSSKKDTTHKFLEKGTHYVTLKVTDNDGNQDSVTKTVRIINLPPRADFTVSEETVKVGKEVSFIDSSTDPEDETMSYLWDFGDGSTSNQRNPVHKYEESGQYTVELSVSDDEDATSSKSLTVRVQESGQNWIPGFPIESIAFGLVLSIILVTIISKRS